MDICEISNDIQKSNWKILLLGYSLRNMFDLVDEIRKNKDKK